MKRMTLDEFISRANKVHNNKYDYSLVEYKNIHSNIKIICPIHGEFEQEANNHVRDCGCPKCSMSRKTVALGTDEFIRRAIKVHGNKYNYDSVVYKALITKVIIKCHIHGNFEQSPAMHLNGYGCKLCSKENKKR